MLIRLAHVCLNVADLNQTVAFYHGLIGLPMQFTFEKDGKRCGVYFTVGQQTFIEAFQVGGVQVVNTGITHFCLECDDIDAFMADMGAKGVACTEKKLGCDHAWQTWLTDPDGNRFEIHQYTNRSSQLNGGVVQVDW